MNLPLVRYIECLYMYIYMLVLDSRCRLKNRSSTTLYRDREINQHIKKQDESPEMEKQPILNDARRVRCVANLCHSGCLPVQSRYRLFSPTAFNPYK